MLGSLKLDIGAGGATVSASYSPSEKPETLRDEDVVDALKTEGVSDLYVFPEGLTVLREAAAKGAPASAVLLAERRDGRVTVVIAPDALSATASLSPAWGGVAVSREMLVAAISAAGVVNGGDDAAIDKLLTNGSGEAIVARGTPPTEGAPTQFEQLVNIDSSLGHPHEREDGTVDYFDLGQAPSVKPGTPLMGRTLPQKGEPGVGVRNEPIPAKAGQELFFGVLDSTVQLSPGDPRVIVARLGGEPRFGPTWVRVESKKEVREVGPKSGNIRFEGNVVISGSVAPGFSVVAGGDIFVAGLVEVATLDAGGNVTVRGGIEGHGANKPAKIRARGTVRARFIDSAVVEAGEHVYVTEFLMKSVVSAIGNVEVAGGAKARIIGGSTSAGRCVKARVLGSPGSIATHVEVGFPPPLRKRMDDIGRALDVRAKKLEELEKQLVFLKKAKAAHETVEHKQDALRLEVQALLEEQRTLHEALAVSHGCKIIALSKVHVGVELALGDQTERVDEELGGRSFSLKDGKILIGAPTL